MKIKLDKLGADPELAIENQDGQFIPAEAIVGKTNRLASFIGTDGHAATGELRPPPSRNILRVLFSLAEGLDLLEQKTRLAKYTLVARPVVQGEPLGGHVHFSLTQDYDDLWVLAYNNSVLPGLNGPIYFRGKVELHNSVIERLDRVAATPEAATPVKFSKALCFLGNSLEYAVMPTVERIQRNYRYGGPDDMRVVLHKSPRPRCHFQYEYRVPSTWLTHPRLAYAYLATVKLTLLNLDKFEEAAGEDKSFWPYLERLGSLGQLRRSRDLRFLENNVAWLRDNVVEMWQRRSIWIEEWRKLANRKLPEVCEDFPGDQVPDPAPETEEPLPEPGQFRQTQPPIYNFMTTLRYDTTNATNAHPRVGRRREEQ